MRSPWKRASAWLTMAVVMSGLLAGAGGLLAAGPPSLYQRLGGYDAIAAVTDDFLARLNLGAILLSRANPSGAAAMLTEAVRIGRSTRLGRLVPAAGSPVSTAPS